MKKLLLLLFVMFVPQTAQSAWVNASGKPIAETESMRSSGDFGVQLVLAPDEKQFRRTCKITKNTPIPAATDMVHRGSSVAAVLIFHGCTPNAVGVCDIVSEFFLENPDGVQIPASDGPVCASATLQGGLLNLGLASTKLGFASSDSVGAYKVIANVRDNNSGRSLRLATGFTVTR